jgi:diguanylate cyclase (GGDEF)-like protein
MIILDIALTGLCIYLYRQTKRCSYTGLLDKRQFNTDLKRMRTNDHVIIIDIDKFKQINDTKGHAHGDIVINQVAHAIKSSIRLSDRAYRIGGDEFAIITNYDSTILLERIQRKINVFISIGKGANYHEADKQMYTQKQGKANR